MCGVQRCRWGPCPVWARPGQARSLHLRSAAGRAPTRREAACSRPAAQSCCAEQGRCAAGRWTAHSPALSPSVIARHSILKKHARASSRSRLTGV